MRWCCFKFWFYYRLILTCLAHTNWLIAIYVNCVFFVLWKSYDLLWFWMHFILCACFVPLRSENYLLVWINLVHKRFTKYPEMTYKEIYVMEYGPKRGATKSERDLHILDEADAKEAEEKSSSSEEGALEQPGPSNRVIDAELGTSSNNHATENGTEASEASASDAEPKTYSKQYGQQMTRFAAIGEEEQECMEQLYITGQNPFGSQDEKPVPPPRKKRVRMNAEATTQTSECADENANLQKNRWYERVPVLRMISKRGKRDNAYDSVVSADERSSTSSSSPGEEPGTGKGFINGLQKFLPKVLQKSDDALDHSGSSTSYSDALEVLKPDFTNVHDAKTQKEQARREKKERKELAKRLRERRRLELAAVAKKEAKARLVSSSVELLLQLLRMLSSFALLVGTIRKTFLFANFYYEKPGHERNTALVFVFRMLMFVDVFLFWASIIWAYCLQWHLCCRLGLLKFWLWVLLLLSIGGSVMILPMTYVQLNLDSSWCNFQPNSTLARYQPNW